MEDITMVAELDSETTLYVSPVHDQTYQEYVDCDNLGGSGGYFIARQRHEEFEVLAKAKSLDTAREIFGMLTAQRA